ncbi:hypothetical protein JTE90_013239 [Oedothorax gibbosus]|uniref:Uncharacterized protein n=1 Tax=Oedothorax gibbosus TaxID=931172 RepID=A0AAV6VD81_9ARAC|nr:hypothetical protein JTE90_013239 [Oedothorax gibbosus]
MQGDKLLLGLIGVCMKGYFVCRLSIRLDAISSLQAASEPWELSRWPISVSFGFVSAVYIFCLTNKPFLSEKHRLATPTPCIYQPIEQCQDQKHKTAGQPSSPPLYMNRCHCSSKGGG